ncbi:RCC1 domain-containing protein [Deinococcus oregonensis]|uniref:RCC1 domain-containing protein n=1 Tax=Deinococcus oregonensis TaxID=1805970 RepID=A0ABV6AVH8_9DEIO
MKRSGVLLFTGLLALTACSSVPSVPEATPNPAALRLGMVEIEFKGGNAQPLQASLVRPVAAQALTDQPCLVLGAVISKGSDDLAGKRYLKATFPVTNNCATDLENLTYVAVRRLGADATLGGTAITAMNTFGETDVAVGLAIQILPTQPVDVSGRRLQVDQNTANLQVFDDTAGGELDGLQAQVDAGRTTYDLLPYGFVTTSEGSRGILAGGTGEVTFALSVPIQPTPAEDVFSFRILMSAATNSVTSITQGLEEQDAAGKAAVETRAAALPGAEIRTLLGPSLTPTAVANNSLAVCQVRTAGPRGASSATLVNVQPSSLRVIAPSLPSILGGVQRQPQATLTVNGSAFPTWPQYRSLTPATLRVTNILVHPVASSPLARQTGTVQGRACGLTASATLPTSPFAPLITFLGHSLALNSAGAVVGWGTNAYGQLTVPAGLSGAVAVAAGYVHSLALKADGTVVAWGNNDSGQVDVPAGLSGVVAVSAGFTHSVALKADGTVVAWGGNGIGQADVPAGLSDVVAVAAGFVHSLALKADGTVVAWGDNRNGQASVPAGLSGVVAVAAGTNHSLALKSDGTVVAWGRNDYGQVNVPAGLSGVVAVSAGESHSLALKSDGTVVAWGDNRSGQLNAPAGLSDAVVVTAGYFHSVALKADGTVVAWGNNQFGQGPAPAGVTVMVP